MNDFKFNADDGQPHLAATDRPGRAALLLVESLIHGLIARSLLSVVEAIEIIETAARIERETMSSRSECDGVIAIRPPPSLLAPLAASLGFDLTD